MISFIKKGIFFFSYLVVGYLILMACLFFLKINGKPLIYRFSKSLSWHGGDTQRKFKEFNPKDDFDLIVLGASRAYRGYDPRVFKENNLKIYNLGTHAQRMENTFFIVDEYLKEGQKAVVIDVHLGNLMGGTLESTSNLIANVTSDKAAFEIAKNENNIYCLNMYILRMLSKYSEPIYAEPNYVKGGFVFQKDSIEGELNLKDYYPNPKLEQNHLNALNDILEILAKRKIEVALALHPIPHELEKHKFKQLLFKMDSISQNRAIPFINLGFEHDLNTKEHFFDLTHLNEVGARKYNELLIPHLINSFPHLKK